MKSWSEFSESELYKRAEILLLHIQRTRNAERRKCWAQAVREIVNELVLREVARAA
jgi:hypothetical protein